MTAVAISSTVEIWKADVDDAPVVVVPVVDPTVTSDAESTEDGKRVTIPRIRGKAWRVLGVEKGKGDVARWTERERAPHCMRCMYIRTAVVARRLTIKKVVCKAARVVQTCAWTYTVQTCT